MIQLPTHHPKEKKKHKYCQYLDCNKEFWGRPIQKYCDFHTDPHHRKRIRPKPEDPQVRNMVFAHTFHQATDTEFECALEGCEHHFDVTLYPGQQVYPKFCEKHRSEYQRDYFMRLQKLEMTG